MAAVPIRSQTEIDQILNRANHTIADLGLEIINDANQGIDISDVDYKNKVYRIVLLRAYLKNIIDPTTAEPKLYYSDDLDNEKKYNILLDAVVELSGVFNGPGIPLIRGRRMPIYFFPSTSGASTGGSSNSGGPATPGGITFQNTSVDDPGEVVDRLDASSSEYAFYIVNVRGTGVGEGSRLDILGVNWRGSADPVITNYRGNDIGGSTTGVTFSAALVSGAIELTCNVPSNGWIVRGTRISFETISFQNALGPLPTGGTVGQYLRKTTSTDFEAAFANIAISEVALLVAALAEKIARDGSIAMTGNLALGGNKITGLAAAIAAGEAVRYEQLPRTLSVQTNNAGTTGPGEDDLHSYNVPANTLSVDGNCIRFTIYGTTSLNFPDKQIRVRFGNQIIFNSGTLPYAGNNWVINGEITRISATGCAAVTTFHTNYINDDADVGITGSTVSIICANANVLKVTGEASIGATTNDIVSSFFKAVFEP
jgi:hypothetical protein